MPAVATKTSEAAPSESRVIFNNKGEVSTVDQMKYNIENTTASWEVIIDSLLVDFLTPNKEFELVFLSSKLAKYNGKYKIAKFVINFNKSDGEWFTTVTKASFNGKKPRGGGGNSNSNDLTRSLNALGNAVNTANTAQQANATGNTLAAGVALASGMSGVVQAMSK
jgi:hypothetical protein